MTKEFIIVHRCDTCKEMVASKPLPSKDAVFVDAYCKHHLPLGVAGFVVKKLDFGGLVIMEQKDKESLKKIALEMAKLSRSLANKTEGAIKKGYLQAEECFKEGAKAFK